MALLKHGRNEELDETAGIHSLYIAMLLDRAPMVQKYQSNICYFQRALLYILVTADSQYDGMKIDYE